MPGRVEFDNLQGFDLGISAFSEYFERFGFVRKDHADGHVHSPIVTEDFDGCAIHQKFEVNSAVHGF